MKRAVNIILCTALAAALLTGCGAQPAGGDASAPEAEMPESAEAPAPDADNNQSDSPSGKSSEERESYPVDLVGFSSLDEFLEYLQTAEENGDVADLASLEFFYYPAGIPDGYRLYKISAGAVDIGFWFLPDEDCSSRDAALAGEAQQKHFLFISSRGNMRQSGAQADNKLLWDRSDASLMMYLPKGYVVSDRAALCETVKYVRNEDTRTFEIG